MKVLFVQNNLVGMETIGLMTISAVLKENGYQTKLLYGNSPRIIEKVKEYRPDVIGYYITSGVHTYLINLNRRLKKEYGDFFSIFGGPHATFFPDLILDNPEIDAVNIGEGELSMLEFVKTIDQTGQISNTRISSLWIRKNNEIIKNEIGNLIEDLDQLPFYDRDLFQEGDPNILRSKTRLVMFARGCPYSCTYCYNREIKRMYKGKGKFPRAMSVRRAIAELKHAIEKSNGVKHFYIHDDEFVYAFSDESFEEFCSLYSKEINIPFTCYLPLRRRDKYFIRKMKEIGCCTMSIGFETANEKIRKEILKRPKYSNEDIMEIGKHFRDCKVKLTTGNLCGLPVANSLKNDIETLKFNMKLKPTFASSYLFYPYPKTELGDVAYQGGFVPKQDVILYNTKCDTLLTFPDDQKLKIEKNALLFGTIVSFSFLFRFHKYLMKLPKFFLYLVFLIHKGYNETIRLRPYFSICEFINNVTRILKYMSYIREEKLVAEQYEKRSDKNSSF